MAYKYSTVAFLQMIKESTIATWFVCFKMKNHKMWPGLAEISLKMGMDWNMIHMMYSIYDI